MKENNCIRNLLKLICLLQNNSTDKCLNTRIISIYKRNGELLNISNNTFFRVMNINKTCVTLLILNNDYTSTNQYFTIDIKCIGAIKCIIDTYIANL